MNLRLRTRDQVISSKLIVSFSKTFFFKNFTLILVGPLDLISTLFSSSSCSYRIESYWTYEVCHGNYIKQFHEEREGKTSKRQEYFLGKWDKQKTEKLRKTLEDKDGEKLKYKKIDGLSLPYLEFEMTDGTLCDLINNQPRVTKVLYVCYAPGKNEVYSLKEVSTCNYEVIILTPTLCAHPSFKPTVTAENNINCVPLDESPDMPKSLMTMELESLKAQYQKLSVSFDCLVVTLQLARICFRLFLFFILFFYFFFEFVGSVQEH